jgi:ABC-type Fe3+-hydroxamate transport system substrate-binding protein
LKDTQTFTDQMGRAVEINFPPIRIISLVPSQTELLYHLGLEEEVVGITKFCVHPKDWFNTKTRVGGTKKINFEVIAQLKPDLIIANKEENEREQIKELSKLYPVWISDIITLNDSLQMIQQIGKLTDKENKSSELVKKIKAEFNLFKQQTSSYPPLRTLYFIWNKPYMLAGKNTFINEMLSRCNFNNALNSQDRYPELTIEQIKSIAPELILLSSEPYPFKQKHIDELKIYLPNTKIILVDGELFSWYGSRLLEAPKYFKKLLKDLNEL